MESEKYAMDLYQFELITKYLLLDFMVLLLLPSSREHADAGGRRTQEAHP